MARKNIEQEKMVFLGRVKNNSNVEIIEHGNLRRDIVLSPSVESVFDRIEKEYFARKRLATYGLKHASRMLFYGPPGTGKTLGAECLAHRLGLPLLLVRADKIIESYLGSSQKNLTEAFKLSKDYPCVFFLDECDSLAWSRGAKGNDVAEMRRVVNTLLVCMDDFEREGLGVFVAATNLQENLDSALFRRFDEVVHMKKPGKAEVENLLRFVCASFPVAADFCWGDIAEDMVKKSYSASHVVGAAKKALKIKVMVAKGTFELNTFDVLEHCLEITE